MRTATTVTVDARPEPVELDPATTALIVVDMQNDFGSPGGMFDRAGIDITGIQNVVPNVRRVLDGAHAAGITVVYLKMGYQPDLSDLGSPNAPNRTIHQRFGVGDVVEPAPGVEGRVLVRDTWGTDIVDELTPAPGDMVLYKTRYSGFFATDLDDRLRAAGIEDIVFTGCTTSVCVESTLRDAFFRDYRCLLLEDCCAEAIGADAQRTNHEATVDLVQILFGAVAIADRFLAALAVA